jgi:hypothetical protein
MQTPITGKHQPQKKGKALLNIQNFKVKNSAQNIDESITQRNLSKDSLTQDE